MVSWLGCTVMVLACLAADDRKELPPIEPVSGIKPLDEAFKDGKGATPLVIRSAKDAARYFDEKGAAKLAEQVDFEKQVVLLFAWRGSGQDKLNYEIRESFPEQIAFKLTRGRTRDLREHVAIYVLRSNVKWDMK